MSLTHFRIFVSSPGDVPDERAIAANVIENLPYDRTLQNKITVEAVAWDRPGAPPMEANIPPQEAINMGLPLPSQCDIVIVIFWARMGTPVRINDRDYQSGTEFEYREAMENRSEKGLPSILVYRRTEDVAYSPKHRDYLDKYDQFQKVEAFFEDEFKDSNTGAIRGGFNPYETPDDFRSDLTSHLRYVIQRTLESNAKASTTDVPVSEKPQLWTGSPFPGLRAFTHEDEPIFFGRGVETDKLVRQIRNNNFVAVVGASGSGKSSLVSAGVLPRIRKTSGTGQWIILTATPDALGQSDPFASLSDIFTETYPDDKKIPPIVDASFKQGTLKPLLDYLVGDDTQKRLLLFIDQFEELFTTVENDLALKFILLLLESLKDPRLHIVMTVRGDFYNNCIEIKELAEILQGSTFPLAAPKRDALRMMIQRPAERAGLKFEDDAFVKTILDNTGDSSGALALLAYLLDELFHRRTNNVLTRSAYKELEGVQGAIGRRSEQTYENLTEEQQAAMTSVFRELVSVKEDGTVTRRRAAYRVVGADAHARAFIQAMVKARLLVVNSGRDNQPYVEVAHEALLRSWERLVKWIAITQDDLRLLQQMRQAALEWDRSGRQDYRLWKHELLQPVYDMQSRLNVEFDEVEQAFTKPEAERLLTEYQRYKAGGSTDAQWRQRSTIARLDEIGHSTIPILISSIKYSSTAAVKSKVVRSLHAYPIRDIIEHIEKVAETSTYDFREAAKEYLWNGYLQKPWGTYPKSLDMAISSAKQQAGILEDAVVEAQAKRLEALEQEAQERKQREQDAKERKQKQADANRQREAQLALQRKAFEEKKREQELKRQVESRRQRSAYIISTLRRGGARQKAIANLVQNQMNLVGLKDNIISKLQEQAKAGATISDPDVLILGDDVDAKINTSLDADSLLQMIQQTTSGRAWNRLDGIRKLRKSRDDRAIPFIIECIYDGDTDVRTEARMALRLM